MTPNATNEHERHVASMVGYYARTAAAYNSWHADLKAKGPHNFAVRGLIALVKDRNHKTVLDVCCGTGRALKVCLDQGIDAHGVDVSQELIDQGVREWNLPPNRFTCGDATKLPFPDESFDVSCVLGALHHCAIPHRIVEEMIRVTRHAIIISDEGNHLHLGIKTILQKLGLFELVYRLAFRRPPRTERRAVNSSEDGPAYIFSTNEILPLITSRFHACQTYQFYRLGDFQVASRYFPRLFARNLVVIAESKRGTLP